MISTKTERKGKFESIFALVRDELLAHLVEEGLPADVVLYTRLSVESSVQGGNLNGGMSFINTVELLKSRDLTQDEYTKAAVLVSDEVISGSRRRGLSCWYRDLNPSLTSAAGDEGPPIGVVAIDEFMVLKSAIFRLLKTHFRKESYYADLVELSDYVAYKRAMGKLMDVVTTSLHTMDFVRFTFERSAETFSRDYGLINPFL
ncbi:hypothetical protein C0993_008035 [Termitomyces sp. T159_Od127]|nr:hypothetical protein C0993_008035 [Termitomyces sp. T159_Od127]